MINLAVSVNVRANAMYHRTIAIRYRDGRDGRSNKASRIADMDRDTADRKTVGVGPAAQIPRVVAADIQPAVAPVSIQDGGANTTQELPEELERPLIVRASRDELIDVAGVAARQVSPVH